MPNKKRLPKRKIAAFHRKIGELVFWFAGGENIIYLIANHLLGGRKIAKPVLANMHLERTVELIRALAKELHSRSKGLGKLDAALLAFKRCAQERNQILHSVAFPLIDSNTGVETIEILNARTMGSVERENEHIEELTKRVRETTAAILEAGLNMGLFNPRTVRKLASARTEPKH